jgi:alpha-tubulin suppressor-like RCC1 family protein
MIRYRTIFAWALSASACGFREVPIEPACFEYIVASDSHSCARKTDGTAWCWGNNQQGQLGVGDTGPRTTPIRLDALDDQVAGIYTPTATGDISTRTAFTCALKREGTLWCWGNNEYGQLGTGDRENRSTPTWVEALGSDVHAASLGSAFGCARKKDNSLWCWGANESGQLGTGDTEPRMLPEQIDPDGLGREVRRISAGGAHTCARKNDGNLYCWGANSQGQLGTNDTNPRLTPTPVDSPDLASSVDVIVLGAAHSCATRANATLWCWGANQYGQLGLGGNVEPHARPEPVDLPNLAGTVPLVTAGANHTCAAKTDGTLWCFGNNRAGQLGTGDRENRSTPAEVDRMSFGTQVAVVYAGGNHTCARRLDSSVWCWGNNDYGQLGVQGAGSAVVPIEVVPACP